MDEHEGVHDVLDARRMSLGVPNWYSHGERIWPTAGLEIEATLEIPGAVAPLCAL